METVRYGFIPQITRRKGRKNTPIGNQRNRWEIFQTHGADIVGFTFQLSLFKK